MVFAATTVAKALKAFDVDAFDVDFIAAAYVVGDAVVLGGSTLIVGVFGGSTLIVGVTIGVTTVAVSSSSSSSLSRLAQAP